jgi:gamma-glutamyltranspeptidase/glutathione hydrolase
MGASMQAQAHFQVVRRVVDDGLDPQAALDAARFRATGGRRVLLEPGLAGAVEDLRARGHDAVVADVPHAFGVGQMILVDGEALVAGSDGRADGHAAGL